MALALDPSLNPRKRTAEDEPAADETWTVVSSQKKSRQTGEEAVEPVRVRLNKLRVISDNPTEAYRKISQLKLSKPHLRFSARPNLSGQWILTPHDQKTLATIISSLGLDIIELRAEDRTKKAIVIGVPHSLPATELCKHEQVSSAVRMKNKQGDLTQTVLCTFIGSVPEKVDIGIFGKFKTKPYYPEPLRCYNCQHYGHHKTACKAAAKCAVCSGRHPTANCIDLHKKGQQTSQRCPNCKQEHPAWHRRCPVRINRIQAALPKQKSPSRARAPTPRARDPTPRAPTPAPAKGRARPTPAPRKRFYSKEELNQFRSSSQKRHPLPQKKPEPLPRTMFLNTLTARKLIKDFTSHILDSCEYQTSNATLNLMANDLVQLLLSNASIPPASSPATPPSSSSSSSPPPPLPPSHPTPPSLPPPPPVSSCLAFPSLPTSSSPGLLPTPSSAITSTTFSSTILPPTTFLPPMVSRDPRRTPHTSSC